ncbi:MULTISPECIES: HD domain-containing protein [unclassified Niallia]|uniref:HD domain-containing protein n=1 Tax=Niallia sp. Man26 TaxID=2912824 RepID=UPI001ED9CB8B|nr:MULTISPECIES: HD domain-containing protein [unclassified Niallia]MDL0437091.1 HD domain-containing protein [Niallia sp. SS-2023]UPO86346.1 HD domain-containing protein [Niallia sp. Man26]
MDIIQLTENFVKDKLKDDVTGHDWHHIDRVRNTALFICEKESSGNPFIIELAAILHDVADAKLNESKEEGTRLLEQFLESLPLEQNDRNHIVRAIATVSYSGGNNAEPESIEAKIVQDADRLDAIGAIGIARTFAYGGKKGHVIYDPSVGARENMTEEVYRSGQSSTIQHFYEKLLKLKDLLHTNTARTIAAKRHQLMENYLKEFYKEWNGSYEEYFN